MIKATSQPILDWAPSCHAVEVLLHFPVECDELVVQCDELVLHFFCHQSKLILHIFNYVFHGLQWRVGNDRRHVGSLGL